MIKNARLNYRNILTQIESNGMFRVAFSSLMNNILCTKATKFIFAFIWNIEAPQKVFRDLAMLSWLCLCIEDDHWLCLSTCTCKCVSVCV